VRRRGLAVAAVLAGLIVGACDPGEGVDGQAGDNASPTPDEEEQAAEAAALQAECEEQLGDFLAELNELNSRLTIGLTLQEYGERVADVRVAYDQVPFDDLQPDCLQDVAVPAEDALNSYVRAYRAWDRCITLQCPDFEEEDLQSRWSDATASIDEAEQGLAQLGES
jgi:hypothetical protein